MLNMYFSYGKPVLNLVGVTHVVDFAIRMDLSLDT